MTTVAQKQTWLAEAETARHNIATTRVPQTINVGDEQITYTSATLPDLNSYITQLIREIAEDSLPISAPRRTALYFEF